MTAPLRGQTGYMNERAAAGLNKALGADVWGVTRGLLGCCYRWFVVLGAVIVTQQLTFDLSLYLTNL